MARDHNAVDEELHNFVTAKFCDRLRECGLLDHPFVQEELATNKLLGERCVRRTGEDGVWQETENNIWAGLCLFRRRRLVLCLRVMFAFVETNY